MSKGVPDSSCDPCYNKAAHSIFMQLLDGSVSLFGHCLPLTHSNAT